MDPASLATNAFGQNFNVTMTQMAASFCSLLNGGNYYEPHVVKQIQDENGNVTENKDPVLVKKTISKETSDIIKDYMQGVVEEGTGASAAVEGMLSEVRPVQPRSCLVEMENILFLSSDMHHRKIHRLWCMLSLMSQTRLFRQTVVMQHSLHHRS